MADTPRAQFLRFLKATTSDETARKAKEAHARFSLHPPTIEELASYRRSSDIEAAVADRCVESLLSIRTRPLKCGQLKQERQKFQKEVLSVLLSSAYSDDKTVAKEYEALCLSISRLIALYYVDAHGRQPHEVEGRLALVLPHLAGHLLAETELCLEARFTAPRKNLSKVSVFDIQQKLGMLEAHEDDVVRENARNIVCAALNKGNLGLAERLASGAKEKLGMLEAHPDPRINRRAKSIISQMLNRGSLEGFPDEDENYTPSS